MKADIFIPISFFVTLQNISVLKPVIMIFSTGTARFGLCFKREREKNDRTEAWFSSKQKLITETLRSIKYLTSSVHIETVILLTKIA